MRILGIVGSVRRGSHNRALLRAAAELLPPGVELVVWERLADVPLFNEDLEALPAPAAVRELRDAVRDADAVLIATPEYNTGMPGVLKNALDWLSRPFDVNPLRGKPVAVVGASTGLFGAVWAQAEVRRVVAHMGGDVLDRELPIGIAHEAFHDDGGLRDEGQAEALATLLTAFVETGGKELADAA